MKSAALVLSMMAFAGLARAAEPMPMTAERWTTSGEAAFVAYKGYDALQLKDGNAEAVLNGVTFGNGTIEFDVELTATMGTGIGFRRLDENNYEDFYFRPRQNCAEAYDCTQYAPKTHGVLLWDFFPQYQAPAAVRDGVWNHVKLVVSGQRMNVFVNDKLALKVGRLEGDALQGGVLLQGPGTFANLTMTPGAVEGLAAEPESDATASDPRFIRNWQLSPASVLAPGVEPDIADLPAPSAGWTPLAAERGGLMNITRRHGWAGRPPNRKLAWLKTTITSKHAQTKSVRLGWCREVWVFVNGRLVYADKNPYQPPEARKTPNGRCSLENGAFQLPLKVGANEVAVAVADNFYGWGLIMRLDDTEDVRLTPP
jgi:hypothetical protein